MVLLRRSQLILTLLTRLQKFKLSYLLPVPRESETRIQECTPVPSQEQPRLDLTPDLAWGGQGVCPQLHPQALLWSLTQNTVE